MKNYITNSLNRLKADTVQSESGHALIEFSLIAPFMIFLCLMGTIEVGTALQDHQKLSAVVASAARASSSYSGLFEVGVGNTSTSSTCSQNATTVNAGGGLTQDSHHGLHLRICELLHFNGYTDLENNDFVIETTPTLENNIRVAIKVPYQGILNVVLPSSLETFTVERVAPYMKPI